MDAQHPMVAIVGLSGRFPGAAGVDAWWRNLRDGVESISFFTPEETERSLFNAEFLGHPAYVRAGGLLDGIELFDAAFFGYSGGEAELMDPQHRVFLELAWEALEHAGLVPSTFDGRIGVFAGCSFNQYLIQNLLANRGLHPGRVFQALLTNDKDFLPTRVSYKLDLTGPSVNVQTACSTSLVAVHYACQALLNGECDAALAGGISIRVPQRAGYLYVEEGIASPDGRCRAFDARAQGTVAGNGAGVVVLRRLEDALADGDPIHAVIRGSAVNNDGAAKVGFTAPSVDGQAEVIAEALSLAGVDAGSIGYVEAHGTATALGDPIEVAALTRAFRLTTDRVGDCALGSVKTNVGHLDAAAGVAGLIKVVLALEHGLLPPSLHFERPNPRIGLEGSPFFVNDRLRAWERNGTPRRAGVSSLGMGGTNAHVVVEEAPAAEPSGPPARPWQLLLLSARSATALESATAQLREVLAAGPPADPADLADIAWTLQTGRHPWEHRRAVVCRDAAGAAAALERPDELPVRTGVAEAGGRPVVFLFPGQGAQHPGMAAELYATEEVFREEMDRCCEILRSRLGLDLRDLVFPEDGGAEEEAERLRQTCHAQPALFAVEYALARQWMAWGIAPHAMVGHSLGEYVAACLAGVLTLEDALALVAARGRLMQELPAGAMSSVPLAEGELAPLLGGGVALAAINAPDRCVVSGPEPAVAELEARLAARGVACRRVPTSHAFHSEMMDPILRPFAAEVARIELRAPRIPYLSNLTGTWITPGQAMDHEMWVRHLREPVRFAGALAELTAEPAQVLLEVGPGQTLTALARRHPGRAPRQAAVPSLPRAQDGGSDAAALVSAVGQLWIAGAAIDWRAFHGEARRRRVPLPTYPFERRRYWIDPGIEAGIQPGREGVEDTAAVISVAAAVSGIPAGTVEERLAALWQRFLGLERVNRNDNFFELGGDSVLGLQIVTAAVEQGMQLSLHHVFSHQTLAEMAAVAAGSDLAGPALPGDLETPGTAGFQPAAALLTPSDFPEADLSQEAFDNLIAHLSEVLD